MYTSWFHVPSPLHHCHTYTHTHARTHTHTHTHTQTHTQTHARKCAPARARAHHQATFASTTCDAWGKPKGWGGDGGTADTSSRFAFQNTNLAGAPTAANPGTTRSLTLPRPRTKMVGPNAYPSLLLPQRSGVILVAAYVACAAVVVRPLLSYNLPHCAYSEIVFCVGVSRRESTTSTYSSTGDQRHSIYVPGCAYVSTKGRACKSDAQVDNSPVSAAQKYACATEHCATLLSPV